jgi:hypothetical protein
MIMAIPLPSSALGLAIAEWPALVITAVVLGVLLIVVRARRLPLWISTRCKDVYRVLRDYGPQSVGKTERCAYQKAIKAAEQFAEEWNNSRSMADAEALIGAGGSA